MAQTPKKRAAPRAPRKPRTITDDHKSALAAGREEASAVRRYLEALEDNKPRRGRKRTPESINNRLALIDSGLAVAPPIRRVEMLQERMNLQAELASLQATVDLSDLEEAFVKHVGSYSKRKGITPAAWRALGVPPALLRRAGLSRQS